MALIALPDWIEHSDTAKEMELNVTIVDVIWLAGQRYDPQFEEVAEASSSIHSFKAAKTIQI